MQIGIIDTGSANLNSVKQAFARLGYAAEISSDPQILSKAERLILPGVGTAIACMQRIEHKGLIDFIVHNHTPMLGICLGMQILAKGSAEVELNSAADRIKTLGIVSGEVVKLQAEGLRLPHMGWNTVEHTDHPLFKGIKQQAYFYFDHSFALQCGSYTIGSTEYGMRFSAAVAQDNFMGVQFHPEKSGAAGEQLLRNFIEEFG
ncbi:MAG: imidazole glycerol phosphate synthase subunit HisH [Succinivibrio sp.]|nr:imidazole glycerol phosphate synthase subunit HisH [Succinivibrio sp.]